MMIITMMIHFLLFIFLLFLGMLIVFVLILYMPATLTMQTKLRKRDATTNIGKPQNLFFITILKKSILAYSCCKWPKPSSIIASKEISGILKNILKNQRDTTLKKKTNKQTDRPTCKHSKHLEGQVAGFFELYTFLVSCVPL